MIRSRGYKELLEEIENIHIFKNSIAIIWIGQGGFVFKTNKDKIVYVDPYLSDIVFEEEGEHRLVEIPIDPLKIKADLVFVTHNHLDHLDPVTITGIEKSCQPKFIGPSSCYKHFKKLEINEKRIIEINRGDEKTIDGIKVNAVHAEHSGMDDSIGYVFNFGNIVIYLSGDTSYDKRLESVKNYNPEIAIVCANGKPPGVDINLNAKEAAQLISILNPKLAIPMHYGMLASVDENPQLFVDEMEKKNLQNIVKVMNFKECFIYSKKTC